MYCLKQSSTSLTISRLRRRLASSLLWGLQIARNVRSVVENAGSLPVCWVQMARCASFRNRTLKLERVTRGEQQSAKVCTKAASAAESLCCCEGWFVDVRGCKLDVSDARIYMRRMRNEWKERLPRVCRVVYARGRSVPSLPTS
jgi:hypothetical protein